MSMNGKKNTAGRPKGGGFGCIRAGIKGDLMTIHIQFPTADVAAIDRFASDKRQTRSSLVRWLVITALKSHGYLSEGDLCV